MWRLAVIAAGNWASGTAIGAWVVAQTTGGSPFDWSSIIGGALGSSPTALVLAWQLTKAERRADAAVARSDKDAEAYRAEIKALNEKLYGLIERLGPALSDSVDVMKDLQGALGTSLARAERPQPVDDVTVRMIRDTLATIERKLGP